MLLRTPRQTSTSGRRFANKALRLPEEQKEKQESKENNWEQKKQKDVDELGIEPRTFRMLWNMLSERSTNWATRPVEPYWLLKVAAPVGIKRKGSKETKVQAVRVPSPTFNATHMQLVQLPCICCHYVPQSRPRFIIFSFDAVTGDFPFVRPCLFGCWMLKEDHQLVVVEGPRDRGAFSPTNPHHLPHHR